MFKNATYRYILVASIFLRINHIYAETPAKNIQNQLIRQEEELRQEKRDEEINRLKYHKIFPIYKQKNTSLKDDGRKCIKVEIIKFFGQKVIKKDKILEIITPYQNNCLKLKDINNLTQKLNELYFNQGYITTRATLPMPQTELKQGIIHIKITEGYIADFKYQTNLKITDKRKNRIIKSAFPNLKGKILNLRDIEQGIEQLNNLPGNNAKMQIIPGNNIGESIIKITNKVNKSGNFSMIFDNSGQRQTGEKQMTLALSRNNLLALNDIINISRKSDRNNDDLNKNYTDSFSISLAYGHYSLSYNLYKSNYKTTSFLNNGDILEVYGGGTGNSLSINKMLKRGKFFKSSLDLNLNVKRTDSNSEIRETSVKNYVGSRKLAIGKITSSNHFYTDYGNFIIKPSYQFGTNLFGSLDDKTSQLEQEAQYEAYLLYLYYNRPFKSKKTKLNYSLTLNSQYSEDQLFSSESFTLGGEFSGSGFKESYLQGKSGYHLKNELSLPLFAKISKKTPLFSKIRTNIFHEFGMIKDSNKREYLASSGIKFSYQNKYFNSYITYAKALNQPETIEPESDSVYFNFTFNIDMF